MLWQYDYTTCAPAKSLSVRTHSDRSATLPAARPSQTHIPVVASRNLTVSFGHFISWFCLTKVWKEKMSAVTRVCRRGIFGAIMMLVASINLLI
jgi:hypothetical protein